MPTKHPVPTDETLIAFEEGRLAGQEAQTVVRWLESDPQAEAHLVRVTRGRITDLRSVLEGPVAEIPAYPDAEELADRVLREMVRGPAAPQGGPAEELAGVPRKIRDCEIIRPIGRGGMSHVYLARHRRLHRDCAVKILASRHASEPAFRVRFEREMAILGSLDHPNLVRAFDAGTEGDWLFLVMELLDGVDLQTLVDQFGPLTVPAACAAARQAALGLEHAHRRGMIHRDVKPSNLVLSRSGILKVIDLGLARVDQGRAGAVALGLSHDGDVSSVAEIVGTPDYMAPEQWASARRVDPRTDVYGLGGTLVFLLTGKPPFSAPEDEATWHLWQAHRQQPVPFVHTRHDGISDELVGLIGRCMAKRPEDRPASAAEVAKLLEPFARQTDLAPLRRNRLPAEPAVPRSAAERTWLGHEFWWRCSLLLMMALLCAGTFRLVLVAPPVASSTPRFASDSAAAPARVARLPQPEPGAIPNVAAASRRLSSDSGSDLAPSRALDRDMPAGSSDDAEPRTLHTRTILRGHEGAVFTVAFSPDGRTLASGSDDRTILLWDTRTWKARARLTGHTQMVISLAFSPDGKRLASISSRPEDCRVRLWDVERGESLGTLGEAGRGQFGLAWTPDGRQLLSGGFAQTINIWDLTGELAYRSIPNATSSYIRGLSVSPDGQTVVVGGSGPTRIWSLKTLELIPAELPSNMAPMFSPVGDRVAGWLFHTGRIAVCRRSSGGPQLVWRGHPKRIEGLSYSPDGRFLASAGDDADPVGRLWWAADGRLLAVLEGHASGLYGVTFSPDGRWVATGGTSDHTIRIWDLPAEFHTGVAPGGGRLAEQENPMRLADCGS